MKPQVIGREAEILKLNACLEKNRNVLLEGPVGVGKTFLAKRVSQDLKRDFFRIDGDSRMTEDKLSGWFDPPMVIEKGYLEETFIAGPLVKAMRCGGVLFINELNRLPEGVQNILLPALDEGQIFVPHLGEIHAKDGFVVVATQNPKEFVATTHLSEAVLDRFDRIVLDYQTEEEEISILKSASKEIDEPTLKKCIGLIRRTRVEKTLKRGASIRGAIAVSELFLALKVKLDEKTAFLNACEMALLNRVEFELLPNGESPKNLVLSWAEEAWRGVFHSEKKKL